MTRDAFAARAFLVARGLAAERMAVIGFSKGGTVALYAADRNYLPEQADRFPVALPFYPGCTTRPRVPKPASAVFMALGKKDDYTGIKLCQEIADDFSKAGGKLSGKIYPGAAHGFDGNPANTGMITLRFAENFLDCTLFADEDGQFTFEGIRYVPNKPSIIERIRKSCVRKGASIWTNQRQKEAATSGRGQRNLSPGHPVRHPRWAGTALRIHREPLSTEIFGRRADSHPLRSRPTGDDTHQRFPGSLAAPHLPRRRGFAPRPARRGLPAFKGA